MAGERAPSSPDAEGRPGHYMGTEIDGKWWKRYRKEGFFARGSGRYWYDRQAFYFLRRLTRRPLEIPLRQVVAFETGRWQAGQWGGGRPVLKIVWIQEGLRLSSGFLLSKDSDELERIVADLEAATGS